MKEKYFYGANQAILWNSNSIIEPNVHDDALGLLPVLLFAKYLELKGEKKKK